MAIRIYKKTTAGRRNASVNLLSEVTKKTPEKSLLSPLPKKGGRNNSGKITVQCRGGGHKRRYRRIDFSRKLLDVEGTVVGVEYDPNRSANIALVEYPATQPGQRGEKRYIVAPRGLTDGMTVLSSNSHIEPTPGNCMPLKHIPSGLSVHCVELVPGKGAEMCRSAGSYARLTNKEGKWATLVLPSGEMRQVSLECRATVGVVGNTDHNRVKLGKAGRARHLGRRPKTRGVARNHHDHPLGGGDGKSKGNRPPASKTGVLSKGGPTRQRGKASNKRILRRRASKRYGILRVK